MKTKNIIKIILFFFIGFVWYACEDEDIIENYTIDLNGASDYYESLNENGILEIPIKITCESGLDTAYYKTVDKIVGYESPVVSAGVDIPVSGTTLDTTLKIPVTSNLYQIVIAVYDNDGEINLRTIKVDSVMTAPELSFKNDLDFRNTACIGIPFTISGTVESVHELKSITLTPVINGGNSTPINIEVTDKSSVTFSQSVPVSEGLTHILFEAENTLGGISVDTFKVMNVVSEDFISVTVGDGSTELSRFFLDEQNTISGVIQSGSDITSLEYFITKNGVEGGSQSIDLGNNPINEFEFSIDITGESSIEGLKFVAKNNSGKQNTASLTIPVVHTRIVTLENLEMSTDPDDNMCFFSAYHTPHVFGKDVAINNQTILDWVFVNRGTSGQPCSLHAYGASTGYYDAISPYIPGFSKLTYLLLTSKRGNFTEEGISAIESEEDMADYITDYADYNVVSSSRRVGDYYDPTSKPTGGFVIGWGTHTHPTVSPSVVENVAWAVVYIKQTTQTANGNYKIVFDIKIPKTDVRTANNASIIEPYDPYPL